MSTQCIHGFPSQQCRSCRTCAHGQVTASCTRCRARTTTRSRGAFIAADPERPSEDHEGFEIFYEPSVSGWRYRAAGASASVLSYRSAFLARKATDALPAGATGAVAAPTSKRGSKRQA
jgi:hypothetical protein